MLGRWLGDFVAGYVTVRCYGGHIPELINSAVQEDILIWDIERLSDGSAQLTTLKKHIPALRRIARHTHTKFRFGRRVGVPFYIGQVFHRKLFWLGGIAFSVGLYLLSSLVWDIEVVGAERISPETVEAAAADVGIYKWQWKQSLPDTDILQKQILEKLPDLSFVGVSVHGTLIRIQVAEKVQPTLPVTPAPQDIVADKNGTIREILPVKGKALVQRGQYVHKGDVLISGRIGQEGQNTLVSAKGEVLAEVWYTSSVPVEMKVTQEVMTGNKITKDYLRLGNKAYQVWGYGQSPFAASAPQEREYKWAWKNFSFPVSFERVDYYETNQTTTELTPEQAKIQAYELALKDIQSKSPKPIHMLGQSLVKPAEIQNNVYRAIVLTKVEEPIGTPVQLN